MKLFTATFRGKQLNISVVICLTLGAKTVRYDTKTTTSVLHVKLVQYLVLICSINMKEEVLKLYDTYYHSYCVTSVKTLVFGVPKVLGRV